MSLLLLGIGSAATPVSAVPSATTPIQHVVVIFQENVSFDHYFATYPTALNPPGEPAFYAAPNTPSVNGLSGSLLTNNPNLVNPFRLDRSQAITCDQNHNYGPEQAAEDGGLMNQFVQKVGTSSGGCNPDVVMGYYDGNTVTGLWNYAQNFALNDYSFGTGFGPSTPGALNLISGETAGATVTGTSTSVANGVDVGDLDPTFDDCSAGATAALSGQNIGNLLNTAGLTWGWFQGGFAPTTNATSTAPAVCGSTHNNINGTSEADYSAHHEPFQYYQSTSNPHHLPPSSPAMIGHTDQANHQYDMSSFWVAANAGNLPAVSFLKAPRYEDGHPANSDPLDEQTFLVNTINALQKLPSWSTTAVIINWDDSDGWYDHVMAPIVNPSNDPTNDKLEGTSCGTTKAGLTGDQCGYGPRLPLLVISPYAKANFVDSTLTDQSSILKFIEDNWSLGRVGPTSSDNWAGTLDNMFNFNAPARTGQLILSNSTGEVVSSTLTGASMSPTVAANAAPAQATSTGTGTTQHPAALTIGGLSMAVVAAMGVLTMGAVGLGAGIRMTLVSAKSKGVR